MHTYFNQKKSEELQRLLNKRICPFRQKEPSEIFIQTIEQLKLLKELSINFNTLEFVKTERTYEDIKTFSQKYYDGKFNNSNINISMFFNDHIYAHVIDEVNSPYSNFFNDLLHSMSIEYPDDVQVVFKKNRIKLIEEINRTTWIPNLLINKARNIFEEKINKISENFIAECKLSITDDEKTFYNILKLM